MDYQRIYQQFIADRKAKEPSLTGYTEKHHIVPRSMGGTDAADNLVRLSAGDHFFAHLLLAKIYGGTQWNAVAIMMERKSRKGVTWGVKRHTYEMAKQGYSKYCSSRIGSINPNFSHEVIELHNVDGRSIKAKRSDIVSTTTLNHAHIATLINKNHTTISIHGWFCPKKTALADVIARNRKPRTMDSVFTFVNVDGREFIGTQYEFRKHVNGDKKVGQADIDKMSSGKTNQWKGWYRKDIGLIGWKNKNRTSFMDQNIYTFSHIDGRVLTCTQRDFSKTTGIKGIIFQLKRNKSGSAYGWKVNYPMSA